MSEDKEKAPVDGSQDGKETQTKQASHRRQEKPFRASEPDSERKPSETSESISQRTPQELSEPSTASNPHEKSEPHLHRKPEIPSEPSSRRKPVYYSEPNNRRKPSKVSESASERKPSSQSEPGEGLDRSAPIQGPSKETLRVHLGYTAYGGYQDHQKLRLAHMNRIRDLLRKINENIALNQVEQKKEEKKFEKKYKDENLPKLLEQLILEGKIAKDDLKHIQTLLEIASEEKALETTYKSIIAEAFSDYPIVIRLALNEETKVKGLGPILTAGLVSIFDIHKADHPSSFWSYAGYAPVNGKSVKREKGKKIGFNPDARKLCFQISDSFIKMKTPVYRGLYDKVKAVEQARLKDTEKGWKKHADMRARRYMMKMFLLDFWKAWREIENLPLSEPYVLGILGHDKNPSVVSGVRKN
ncbi:MAG: TIGR-Tas system RNA-guided endonuclease [Nitrososphaerales archaeon]